MYIDIHTHRATGGGNGTVAIASFYDGFERALQGIPCSIGLHPCYLQQHALLLPRLRGLAPLPNVLAIGECGLDRVCNKDMDTQTAVFREQAVLAHVVGKPLVIHCVRAYDELLRVLGETPPAVPVVVHGFNKGGDIAGRLLARGMYLSFGAAIMNDSSPAAAVLKGVPDSMFFLETDDAGVAISDIYKKAAAIRGATEEAVILQVQQNFTTVFKYRA